MTPDEIRARLARLRGHNAQKTPPTSARETTLLARAVRLSLDMIGPVIVGAFLGGMVDRWSHTFPLFLIIGFFLGMAAGFLNLYKFLKLDLKSSQKDQ